MGWLLAGWAATQSGASLKPQPPRSVQIGGISSQLYQADLDRGPGKQPETLMAIVTDVTGRGVEVRLARVIKVQ